jgi:hypothetical protein
MALQGHHLINPNFVVIDENGLLQEYIVYSMDYGKLLSLKVNEMGETIVNSMIITSKLIVAISGSSSTPFKLISTGISTVINAPGIKGRLKASLGAFVVSKRGGVESADIHDVNSLIKKCILDELL